MATGIVSKQVAGVYYSPTGVAHVALVTVDEAVDAADSKPTKFYSYDHKFRISGKTRAKKLATKKESWGGELAHARSKLCRKHSRGQKPQYKTAKKGSPRFGRLLQQDFESYWAFCDADRLSYEAMLAADMVWTEQEEALFEQAWYEAEQELERLQDLYWDEIIDGYRLQQEAA